MSPTTRLIRNRSPRGVTAIAADHASRSAQGLL
jgi:hypothetical protein